MCNNCNNSCCPCKFDMDLFKGDGGNQPFTLKAKALAEKVVCSGAEPMSATDLIAGAVVQSNPGCKAKLATAQQMGEWLVKDQPLVNACEGIDAVTVRTQDNSGTRIKAARPLDVVSQGVCSLPQAPTTDVPTGIVIYVENNCPSCPSGACNCVAKRMTLADFIKALVSNEAGNGLKISLTDGKLKV